MARIGLCFRDCRKLTFILLVAGCDAADGDEQSFTNLAAQEAAGPTCSVVLPAADAHVAGPRVTLDAAASSDAVAVDFYARLPVTSGCCRRYRTPGRRRKRAEQRLGATLDAAQARLAVAILGAEAAQTAGACGHGRQSTSCGW